MCLQHLQSKQIVLDSKCEKGSKFVCMKNAALQGLTAQTIAENDGYNACEWISGH
jgi:hypothetical protein